MTGPEDLQSNRVRVPGVRPPRDGYEMFTCPVGDCTWRKTVMEVELAVMNVPIKGSGPTLSDAIGAALVGRAKATDKILRDHLESHDVIDFLRTIRDFEQQVYNAGYTGVRPHRPRAAVEELERELLRRQPLTPHRIEDMTGDELTGLRDAVQDQIVTRARGPHRRTTEMPEHELVWRPVTAPGSPIRVDTPHRLEDMTGEQRGRAADALQRYEEIDRGPGWP